MLLVIEILDCLLQWNHSDRSRPSDKGEGGGESGHPDPEIRGEEQDQKFFSALRASVWSKNKWAGGRPPPGPPCRFPGFATEQSVWGTPPRPRQVCPGWRLGWGLLTINKKAIFIYIFHSASETAAAEA